VDHYLPWVTGGGGAIVVLFIWVWAFYTGKLHSDAEFMRLEKENEQLRATVALKDAALETERRTATSAAQAGQVTNQLISTLTAIATDRSQPHGLPQAGQPPGPVPGKVVT